MTFKSYSQAGQDRVAVAIIGEQGSFLDIGASHPIEKSNTYGLETQLAWPGVLFEQDHNCACLLKSVRGKHSTVIEGDATKVQWKEFPWKTVHYLSLDVDENSLKVLTNLIPEVRFNFATIEHDEYRFGSEIKEEMLSLLKRHGYEILCPEVCDQGLSFEVWAIDPTLVAKEKADRFRSPHTEWSEFFK